MSRFDYGKLPVWSEDHDWAHDVSASAECDPRVLATRCHLDDSGDVVYSADISLVVRRAAPVRIGDTCFYALIAEPKDRSLSESLLGMDLVMAGWPASRGWHDHGKFQFGSKHRTVKSMAQIEEAFRAHPGAKRDLLQKLGHNPFDTRDKVATAFLCDPYPLDPLRKFILGRESYYGARNGSGSPQSLMAVCEDLPALRDKLATDPILLDMMEATHHSRKLFIRYHRRAIHQWLQVEEDSDSDGGEDAKFLVYEEIASADLAAAIMRTSIDIALAGPEDFNSFRDNLGDDKTSDGRKLAKHRARDIYIQFYWNLWKRTGRARQMSRKHKFTPSRKNVSDAQTAEKQFWVKVAEISQDLELSPESIKETTESIIRDFTFDTNVPGLLYGPDCEISPQGEIVHDDMMVSVLFVLRTAAILKTGWRDARLIGVMRELLGHELPEVRAALTWVMKEIPF